MKKTTKLLQYLTVLLLCIIGLAGCTNDVFIPEPEPDPGEIKVVAPYWRYEGFGALYYPNEAYRNDLLVVVNDGVSIVEIPLTNSMMTFPTFTLAQIEASPGSYIIQPVTVTYNGATTTFPVAWMPPNRLGQNSALIGHGGGFRVEYTENETLESNVPITHHFGVHLDGDVYRRTTTDVTGYKYYSDYATLQEVTSFSTKGIHYATISKPDYEIGPIWFQTFIIGACNAYYDFLDIDVIGTLDSDQEAAYNHLQWQAYNSFIAFMKDFYNQDLIIFRSGVHVYTRDIPSINDLTGTVNLGYYPGYSTDNVTFEIIGNILTVTVLDGAAELTFIRR